MRKLYDVAVKIQCFVNVSMDIAYFLKSDLANYIQLYL